MKNVIKLFVAGIRFNTRVVKAITSGIVEIQEPVVGILVELKEAIEESEIKEAATEYLNACGEHVVVVENVEKSWRVASSDLKQSFKKAINVKSETFRTEAKIFSLNVDA